MDISYLNKLSFAVADNPFYKQDRAKYYPEVYVFDNQGAILAKLCPDCKSDDAHSMQYLDNFRDPKLKVNDDKKVRFALS